MSIELRLIEVAKHELADAKVYAELEKLSGIKADSWRKVGAIRQRATSEMIEWACQEWPQYAFWIVTGVLPTDERHTTPKTERLKSLNFSLHQILGKEPINWSADEIAIIDLWQEDNTSPLHQDLSTTTLSIYLEALKEGKLLKKIIDERKKKSLKFAVQDTELIEAYKATHEGPGADDLSIEELAEFEEKDLANAVAEIERYRDKKIG